MSKPRASKILFSVRDDGDRIVEQHVDCWDLIYIDMDVRIKPTLAPDDAVMFKELRCEYKDLRDE